MNLNTLNDEISEIVTTYAKYRFDLGQSTLLKLIELLPVARNPSANRDSLEYLTGVMKVIATDLSNLVNNSLGDFNGQ